jgi:hypothetical protein
MAIDKNEFSQRSFNIPPNPPESLPADSDCEHRSDQQREMN